MDWKTSKLLKKFAVCIFFPLSIYHTLYFKIWLSELTEQAHWSRANPHTSALEIKKKDWQLFFSRSCARDFPRNLACCRSKTFVVLLKKRTKKQTNRPQFSTSFTREDHGNRTSESYSLILYNYCFPLYLDRNHDLPLQERPKEKIQH